MRIKMKTCLSGTDVLLKPGDLAELPEKLAQRLIASGDAEAAPDEASAPLVPGLVRRRRRVEQATVAAPENTAARASTR